MRQLLNIFMFCVILVAESGCGSLDSVFQDHYSEYEVTETDIVTRPWFERDNPTKLQPIYCYKTLVQHECFDKARSNDERPAVWTYKSNIQ